MKPLQIMTKNELVHTGNSIKMSVPGGGGQCDHHQPLELFSTSYKCAAKAFKSFVYTSAPLTRCAICVRRISGVWLIISLRTWGEQRTLGAWKGHPGHLVLFVFAQKTDKFWFAMNGMWTIRRQRSTGSQSHPHICAFGSQTSHEWFINHLARSCIRGLR